MSKRFFVRTGFEKAEPLSGNLLRKVGKTKEQENISPADIPKELKEALASLQHFGLVANENGILCLTANLFYEWLKEILE